MANTKVVEYIPPTEKLLSLEGLSQEKVNYLYSLLMLTDAEKTLFDDTDAELFEALSDAATGQYHFEFDSERSKLTPVGFTLYED